MIEPIWLDLENVLEAQQEQIAKFGGPAGVRDRGLVESALARPQQLYHYERQNDLLALAIRLGVGLAQNHPFVDGNKRTGAVALIEFLALNGYWLDLPNDTSFGANFEAAVVQRMTEEELADILFPHLLPLPIADSSDRA